MSRVTGARWAAVLTPAGAHVVRYRKRRRVLEVVQYRASTENYPSVAVGADRLADLLEAEGARGGAVALAVAGFGTCHHLLALPPAPAEVLEPILHREMKRFFPDLYEKEKPPPYVGSIPAGGEGESGTPLRDLLIAAVPREVVDEVRTAIASRGIRLTHLTVLPAALARLYQAIVDSPETAAVSLVLPNYCVAGFFHDGALRLFAEPPASVRHGPADSARLAADQVERGSLYLRQQFRGARPTTVWIAAEAEEADAVEEALGAQEDRRVRALDPGEPPGSLLALGAALNAQDPLALDLLPAGYRPPSPNERLTRAFGIAAAAVLLLAGSWWALTGIRAEAEAREEVRAAQEALAPRAASFARIQPVIGDRQAHAVRAQILDGIITERERIPELLWPLQDAAPAVSVSAFHLLRGADGWHGSIEGRATSFSNSGAAAAVEGLHRELSRQLPAGALTLDDLSVAATSDQEQIPLGVAVSFRMSFIVPMEEWTPE